MAGRLFVPLAVLTSIALGNAAWAQGAFPPVSGGAASAFPPVAGSSPSSSGPAQPSAFPPVNGGSTSPFPSASGTRASLPSGSLPPAEGPGPGPGGPPPGGAAQAECLKQASPLRDETQKRANLLQAASKRHASAPEACKLIQSFSQAEVRFLNFVTTKQSACGIPAEVPKQMKEAHAHTEQLAKQVCAAANAPQQGAGPSLSDVLGTPSFAAEDIPTKRKGGSTFDTLKGNVLESH